MFWQPASMSDGSAHVVLSIPLIVHYLERASNCRVCSVTGASVPCRHAKPQLLKGGLCRSHVLRTAFTQAAAASLTPTFLAAGRCSGGCGLLEFMQPHVLPIRPVVQARHFAICGA